MPHTPEHPQYRRRYPYRFPVLIIRPTQACRAVYHNQNTIDGLNALLHGCDDLRKDGRINCNAAFISAVEKELSNQLAQARYIGQSCDAPTVY